MHRPSAFFRHKAAEVAEVFFTRVKVWIVVKKKSTGINKSTNLTCLLEYVY